MSLRRVVVHDVDDYVLPEGDVHYGPWVGMIFASIEADVESFVCHYDAKNCCIGRATGSDRTVWSARSDQMKRIRS